MGTSPPLWSGGVGLWAGPNVDVADMENLSIQLYKYRCVLLMFSRRTLSGIGIPPGNYHLGQGILYLKVLYKTTSLERLSGTFMKSCFVGDRFFPIGGHMTMLR